MAKEQYKVAPEGKLIEAAAVNSTVRVFTDVTATGNNKLNVKGALLFTLTVLGT